MLFNILQLNNQNMLLGQGLNVGDRSIDNITRETTIYTIYVEASIDDPRQSLHVKKIHQWQLSYTPFLSIALKPSKSVIS